MKVLLKTSKMRS